MANLKSSKKDVKRIAKRRERNQAAKSALKTYVKKARGADGTNVEEALRKAVKALDKAVEHGVIHKNQAARRKSRLAKALNKSLASK